jgi:RsiW-degrading membrane proteinase PrsW (M82 family)
MRFVLGLLAVLGPVALFVAVVRRVLRAPAGALAGAPALARTDGAAPASVPVTPESAPLPPASAEDDELGRRHRVALTAATLLLGAMLFVPAWLLEGWVEYYAGLGEHARASTDVAAMVYALFVAAPLEQGLKVLAVTPAWRSRYLAAPRDGVLFGAAAAVGFVSAHDLGFLAAGGFAWLDAARAILAAPAHVFFGAAWGYALGREARDRPVKRFGGRVFNATWLFAMLFNGVYDHIVFGRGEAALLATAPMLLAMGLVSLVVGRSLAGRTGAGPRLSIVPRLSLAPPSMGAVRAALWRTERPVMIRWIGIGALVQMGVILAALAGAVALGHRAGVDFAAVDRGDGSAASAAPLILLGSSTLAAFPVAGYLVARASASRGVLEAAIAAVLAIAGVLLLLGLAAPVAVVFAIAFAPVALGLACAGAWMGMSR